VDARTDVYALGVVLYEMITGRVPFDASTAGEVLRQHQSLAPTPIENLVCGGERVAELEAVVLGCLAKRPDDRYATLAQVAQAIARAVPASLATQPASERRKPGLAPAGGLFARAPIWLLGLGGGILTAGAGLLVMRLSLPPSVRTVPTAERARDLSAGRAGPVDPAHTADPNPANPVVSNGPAEPAASAAPAGATASAPEIGRVAPSVPRRTPAPRRSAQTAGQRSAVRDEIVDPWSR
jgi:serine/threonine-protein kinase